MSGEVLISGDKAINDASVQNAEIRKKKEEEKLRKACADFESLFVYQLFQTMRKTIPAGDPALQSFSKDTYTMMFDQKVAEELSRKGEGIGLQTLLFEQLKKPSKP